MKLALAIAPFVLAGSVFAAAASETTSSGLVFTPIVEGTGASPRVTDTVKVKYRGTVPDGRAFDSSGDTAVELRLTRVIACWMEALPKMKVGGKAKLVCPPSIAYGNRGAGDVIPPGATLNFDVELVDIVRK